MNYRKTVDGIEVNVRLDVAETLEPIQLGQLLFGLTAFFLSPRLADHTAT